MYCITNTVEWGLVYETTLKGVACDTSHWYCSFFNIICSLGRGRRYYAVRVLVAYVHNLDDLHLPAKYWRPLTTNFQKMCTSTYLVEIVHPLISLLVCYSRLLSASLLFLPHSDSLAEFKWYYIKWYCNLGGVAFGTESDAGSSEGHSTNLEWDSTSTLLRVLDGVHHQNVVYGKRELMQDPWSCSAVS